MMNQTIPTTTLDQLNFGQVGTVTALHVVGANRRRLMDLGILPGTKLVVDLKSPLGDPTAYRIRGAAIALRRQQAKQIEITLDNEVQS